jgi:hypothetical protein
MSQNLNITTQIKTQENVSTTINTTTTQTIVREENCSVSYNSYMMKNFKKRHFVENSLEFDNLDAQIDEEFSEIKDYFIMKPIGEYKLFDTICISRLAELNRMYDDDVRSKLYNSVILDHKAKILLIKNKEFSFENNVKADYINSRLEKSLHSLTDEFAYITESFEEEIINKVSKNKTSSEDLEKMRDFISTILDSKNEPNLKNIGLNTDLKIKYIKLANFLLHFDGVSNSKENYKGISQSLKMHLNKIISLRNSLVISITSWIKFIFQDLYEFCHNLEGLEVDNSFINNLQIEFNSGNYEEKIIYNEKKDEKIVNNLFNL